MDTICWMFAFFGFIGFCSMGSLKHRIRKLERQMLGGENVDAAAMAEDLREKLQTMIGQKVEFSFYEDEEEVELVGVGNVQIVDVDEKWVLVHVEEKKKQCDKLIRISSIKGVEVKKENLKNK